MDESIWSVSQRLHGDLEIKGRLWTPGKRSWAEAYRWGHAEPKVERVDSAVRSAHGTVGVGSGGQTDGKAGSGASVIPSRRERGLESGRRKAGAPRQRHRSGPRLRVGRPEESSQQDRHRPPPQQKRPAGPGSKVVRRPFQGGFRPLFSVRRFASSLCSRLAL